MTTLVRDCSVYISWEQSQKLRMISEATGYLCMDELVEKILEEWMTKNQPRLESVYQTYMKARKTAMQQAIDDLKGDKLPE
jgi:hypothetical protein